MNLKKPSLVHDYCQWKIQEDRRQKALRYRQTHPQAGDWATFRFGVLVAVGNHSGPFPVPGTWRRRLSAPTANSWHSHPV